MKNLILLNVDFAAIPESMISEYDMQSYVFQDIIKSFPIKDRSFDYRKEDSFPTLGENKVSTTILEISFKKKYSNILSFVEDELFHFPEGFRKNFYSFALLDERKEFVNKMRWLKNRFNIFKLDIRSYIKLSKLISASANKYNKVWNIAPGGHRWLINLENLMGFIYNPDTIDWSLVDEVLNWITLREQKSRYIPNYINKFEAFFKGIFSRLDNYDIEDKTFVEFIDSNAHYTGGVATIGKIEFTDKEGKIEKCAVKKSGVYLLKTKKELIEDYKKSLIERKRIVTIVIKPEVAKLRHVAQLDYNTYLAGKYVQWLFDKKIGLVLKKWVPLYQNWKEKLDVALLNISKNKREFWRMPFDYAGFDNQVSKEDIKFFMILLSNWCESILVNEDIRSSFRYLIDILDNTIVQIPKSNVKEEDIRKILDHNQFLYENDKFYVLSWENGEMSGEPFTALLDTTVQLIWDLIVRMDSGARISIDEVQGDDLNTTSTKLRYLEMMIEQFKKYNFDFNLKKFYIKRSQSNFLRIEQNSFGYYGFQTRSLTASNSSTPEVMGPIEVNKRLISAYEGIQTWGRRNNLNYFEINYDMWRTILKDGSRQYGKNYKKLANIPRFLGGEGIFINESEIDYSIVSSSIRKPKLTGISINNFKFSTKELDLAIDQEIIVWGDYLDQEGKAEYRKKRYVQLASDMLESVKSRKSNSERRDIYKRKYKRYVNDSSFQRYTFRYWSELNSYWDASLKNIDFINYEKRYKNKTIDRRLLTQLELVNRINSGGYKGLLDLIIKVDPQSASFVKSLKNKVRGHVVMDILKESLTGVSPYLQSSSLIEPRIGDISADIRIGFLANYGYLDKLSLDFGMFILDLRVRNLIIGSDYAKRFGHY
jgi:hypothetical protein